MTSFCRVNLYKPPTLLADNQLFNLTGYVASSFSSAAVRYDEQFPFVAIWNNTRASATATTSALNPTTVETQTGVSEAISDEWTFAENEATRPVQAS